MDRFLEVISRAAGLGPQALARACEQVLASLRPMDQAGARAVVAGDEALARAILAHEPRTALKRIRELASARACIRCATCCRNSSPALLEPDAHLLGSGGPGLEAFYTLRAGERVFSHRDGTSGLLERELIKPREEAGACVFLDGRSCGIYERRPLQCRTQRCWAPAPPPSAPPLTRAQALASDPTALELAREYDLKIPAAELDGIFSAAARGEPPALARAKELVALDERLRRAIELRYGYTQHQLLLILGRPAREVARAYGLAVALAPAR